MSPANSIEMAIWAAVGGRGTLIGPVLGAFVVNGAKSFFTQSFPDYWLYVLGLLFILVTLYLPRGVIGLITRGRRVAGAAIDPTDVGSAAADPGAGGGSTGVGARAGGSTGVSTGGSTGAAPRDGRPSDDRGSDERIADGRGLPIGKLEPSTGASGARG